MMMVIIMFFWKIQLTTFSSDVSHPVRMFSQTVLEADPGLDQLIVNISWSADPEGVIKKRWCHSVKTRISCQYSLRKHPDRMWNVTTKNSKLDFSKEHYFYFYWKSWWISSMTYIKMIMVSIDNVFLKFFVNQDKRLWCRAANDGVDKCPPGVSGDCYYTDDAGVTAHEPLQETAWLYLDDGEFVFSARLG